MKAIKVAIVMVLLINGAVSLFNWISKDSAQPALVDNQVNSVSYVSQEAAAEGLDLTALTALITEVRSGQELERRLNEANSINNLDLNGDKKVDYISVNEFGNTEDKIGFALTTQPVKDETQEIATATVEKNSDTAEIQVVGNEQIYGDQAIYNSSAPIERVQSQEVQTGANATPMYHSYFYPRPLWISPWLFGFYPSFFSPFPIMGRTTYMTRVNNQYGGRNISRGANSYQRSTGRQLNNPYQGKTANKGITRSLKKPTSTQKQFQVNRTRNTRAGGFGQSSVNRSTTASTRASSTRSTGAVRSSRSKSFNNVFSSGRSASTKSSSFRSSSFGSRSFSYGK